MSVDLILQGRATEPTSTWTRKSTVVRGKTFAEAQLKTVKLLKTPSLRKEHCFRGGSPLLIYKYYEAPRQEYLQQRAYRHPSAESMLCGMLNSQDSRSGWNL